MSSALIIIDLQQGFLGPDTAHIPTAVEALQPRFAHIFASKFVNHPVSSYTRLIGWNGMMKGLPETELAFTPAANCVVFEKTSYSACPPAVIQALREASVDTVYVCGLETDICVLKTAADLFDLGFDPVVIEDLCGTTHGPEVHDFAIQTIKRFIGRKQVQTCASIDIH